MFHSTLTQRRLLRRLTNFLNSNVPFSGINNPQPRQALPDPTDLLNSLHYEWNKGWSEFEELQQQFFQNFHLPIYDSLRSLEFARPQKPRPQRQRNFFDIYRTLEKSYAGNGNEADEFKATNDDFDGRSLVVHGQYPHMAALGYLTTEHRIEYKCGGSLISPFYVITAAHCCQVNGDTPVLVKFGIINLKEENDDSEIPQTRIISEVILHPLYNSSLHYHDIALLRLQEPIVFTRFVRPIRLWALDHIPYPHVFTMGYGSTSFAKAPTNILTELDLTLVRLQECNQALPVDESSPEGIVETQICAKDYVHNRDTCQGDSGGPLQLNLRRRSNRPGFRFYLVGIISYGEVCGSGSPGVYTRVSSYIDWIASIVWPEDFQHF
ncbi:serine protease snake-like [Musca vetustissima]|uniref:serine protease snake-like n=1 Tax=Musca vetustissima TaxID=27455 RepID=UPI002AB65AB8|nr:serine protease snake-like [Musca vetustissima]